MTVEIVGQSLRIQLVEPKYDDIEFRTLDVGEPGKLSFVRMLDKKTGEWTTQSIRLNLADYDRWEDVEKDLERIKKLVDEKTYKQALILAKDFYEKYVVPVIQKEKKEV
jgi:hypothetical protein